MSAVNKAKSGGGGEREDNKFYYPERDTAGNGSAIIRFLPPSIGEQLPFVQLYSHGFKGTTGKWYIEECPTTIGEDCYCCEQNGLLVAPFGKWDATPENVKEVVRQRKRKMNYIVNIVVVQDKAHPENEGQQFQFKIGSKIFDKIVDVMAPTDEDDTKFNVFNVDPTIEGNEDFAGCPWPDFKFKIRKVEKQTNYDKSEFVVGDDGVKFDASKIESLDQYLEPTRFKTPDELEKRFNAAIGNTNRVKPVPEPEEEEVAAKPAAKAKAAKPAKAAPEAEADDVEELMRRLAADEDVPQ